MIERKWGTCIRVTRQHVPVFKSPTPPAPTLPQTSIKPPAHSSPPPPSTLPHGRQTHSTPAPPPKPCPVRQAENHVTPSPRPTDRAPSPAYPFMMTRTASTDAHTSDSLRCRRTQPRPPGSSPTCPLPFAGQPDRPSSLRPRRRAAFCCTNFRRHARWYVFCISFNDGMKRTRRVQSHEPSEWREASTFKVGQGEHAWVGGFSVGSKRKVVWAGARPTGRRCNNRLTPRWSQPTKRTPATDSAATPIITGCR